MGRPLQRKNSGTQFQDHHHHHQGCMWGILHMLDYHHWHNLKQRLPHKKHARGRHSRCAGAPKTISFNFHEHQELIESESGQQCNESISRDTCKEEKHEQWEKQTLHNQFKEYTDVFEVYKVNKETFLRSRQCPDIDPEENLNFRTKNLKKFTKSGSFPVADSRTLQHKMSEVWSLPKGDRLLKGTQTPNLVSSKETTRSSPHRLSSQGWTKLFRNHFRHIKLRIKNALKKNRQASSYENGGSECDRRKDMFGSMRRMSSIDESMEKYVWLFDYNFSREAKLHQPKKLRHGVRSYRRNSSLPEMDSLRSSTTETSRDSPRPIKEVNLSEHSDPVLRPMFQWNVVEGGDLEIECRYELKIDESTNVEEGDEIEHTRDNINILMMSEGSVPGKNETCLELDLSKELTQSIPAPAAETFLPSDLISLEELADSQVSEAEMDDISTTSHERIQNVNKIADNHILHLKLKKEHEADFNYVKDVLELSGFIGNEYHEAWHCLDQPLNPSLFKELEVLSYNRAENVDDCYHRIMFDLINEVLLDVYKTSLSYFPKALSCNSKVGPLPTGLHLLEEVWRRTRWYLSLGRELEGSLECAVSRDLSGGGWMSLQLETDCIALELEELIFDELLDEIMCSSYC